MLWFTVVNTHHVCMTGEPTKSILVRAPPVTLQKRSLNSDIKHIVPVTWHVVHDNEFHKLTQNTVVHQINMLNEAYNKTTIFFQLKELNYINNKKIVHLECCETPQANQLKTNYRKGGKETLNIFSADSGYHNYFLNAWKSKKSSVSWSTFPDSPLGLDGVVVSTDRLSYDKTVPTTLAHEIGHWFGLLHTFRVIFY